MTDGELPRNTNGRCRILVILACLVVVIAGMKAASALLVPFFLAVFIAILCSPPLYWLRRKGVPNALAVLVVASGVVVLGLLLAVFLGSTLNKFAQELPKYKSQLEAQITSMVAWLQDHGIEVSSTVIREQLDPGAAMQLAANLLSGLGSLLTNAFLILIIVVFILLEAASLPEKLHAAINSPERSLSTFQQFTADVKRYLAIKTLVSIITGVLATMFLLFMEVDFPYLWGVVAFLFNYIPNIGSIIAAVPPVLLTLGLQGLGPAIVISLGYVALNTLMGNLIEPRFMGRGLGISTLIVFLSLICWGWVLGPVGMLLSVPLTMIVKIALESSPESRWFAVLLSSAGAVQRLKQQEKGSGGSG